MSRRVEGTEVTGLITSEECNPRICVSVRDEACHGVLIRTFVLSRSDRAISLKPLLLENRKRVIRCQFVTYDRDIQP